MTCNTTATEADRALILAPKIHQCSVLKLLEATLKGKKSKKGFEVITGIELGGTPLTEGHVLTAFANPCSKSFSIRISNTLKFVKKGSSFQCLISDTELSHV